MTKKALVILAVLLAGLLVVAADNGKLVRLTVINKSGYPLGIRLVGEDPVIDFYYLNVPEGDRKDPTTEIFTLPPMAYDMVAEYIEIWDPVYGFNCERDQINRLFLFRNIRLTFLDCNQIPPNPGEPTMWKVWQWPKLSPPYFRYLY